jgi:hypothetical protein
MTLSSGRVAPWRARNLSDQILGCDSPRRGSDRKIDFRRKCLIQIVGEQVERDIGYDLDQLFIAMARRTHCRNISIAYCGSGFGQLAREADRGICLDVERSSLTVFRHLGLG